MNNYPVNYRITFFVKDEKFDTEKVYDEFASRLSSLHQCNGQKEYFPVIMPDGIFRQMVATFVNFEKGVMVKIQNDRIDINLQKTAREELLPLKDQMIILLEMYEELLKEKKDLLINRVACCSTYLFDDDENGLQVCYGKLVNDFGDEAPVEWTLQRISQIQDSFNKYPSPITKNILIKRLTIRGRFEEKEHNRILVEIDLNSYPKKDVNFNEEIIKNFFIEMSHKENEIFNKIRSKLIR